MTDPLSKLFGNSSRVKLLRLFLFNAKQSFAVQEASQRARATSAETKKELRLFQSIGLINKVARGKGIRYALSNDFAYAQSLQNLLLNAPARMGDISSLLRGLGTLRLLILSGIFFGEWNEGLDMLIVGDKIQERQLRERVKRLESELGRELRYALLTGDDFFYRINMNDKLIRDVLDYPHKIIIDKINIGIK